MGTPWTIERIQPHSHVVRVSVDSWADLDFHVLLTSDLHHDNPASDRNFEVHLLERAKERGAFVIQNGDTFCAMQGKYDKRSSKDSVRPEHQGGNYLDRLVETAGDFYGSYADNIGIIGRGNHEEEIQNRHETDLIERLVERLRHHYKANCYSSGYEGWVRFLFNRQKERTSTTLFHHHGWGGGGPVTKDMISAQRLRARLRGADIIVTGHTHDSWIDVGEEQTLNPQTHTEEFVRITTVKIGHNKRERRHGRGWAVGKGHPSKRPTACWLHFTWCRRKQQVVHTATTVD